MIRSSSGSDLKTRSWFAVFFLNEGVLFVCFLFLRRFIKAMGKEWISSVSGVSTDRGESQDVFNPSCGFSLQEGEFGGGVQWI